ncbi:MAG: hypothetical protein ABIH46_11505 [Chloroflexota bacterium]
MTTKAFKIKSLTERMFDHFRKLFGDDITAMLVLMDDDFPKKLEQFARAFASILAPPINIGDPPYPAPIYPSPYKTGDVIWVDDKTSGWPPAQSPSAGDIIKWYPAAHTWASSHANSSPDLKAWLVSAGKGAENHFSIS